MKRPCFFAITIWVILFLIISCPAYAGMMVMSDRELDEMTGQSGIIVQLGDGKAGTFSRIDNEAGFGDGMDAIMRNAGNFTPSNTDHDIVSGSPKVIFLRTCGSNASSCIR